MGVGGGDLSVISCTIQVPNYFCIFTCRSIVHLEIDNRKCPESSGECFSKIDEAASFLAAANIKDDLPYPLVSVNSSKSLARVHILTLGHITITLTL